MTSTIYIGVKEENMVEPVIQHIKHLNYRVIFGNNVKSFAELVNKCLKDCQTDVMIFCSHRVRPTEEDINRLMNKINQGYGFVGLYRFAFFGIHREVVKKIGYLDENFISGYEDDDFRIRLNYANIAFYEDHSVEYKAGLTSWTNDRKVEAKYFHEKYTIDEKHKTIKPNIELPNYYNTDYFLTHNDSVYVKDVGSYYGKCGPGIHYFKFV